MMVMPNLLPRGATSDTSKLRPIFTRSTLLFLAVVATVAARGAVSTLTTCTRADLSGAGRTSSLLVGSRDNLSGKVEPGTD